MLNLSRKDLSWHHYIQVQNMHMCGKNQKYKSPKFEKSYLLQKLESVDKAMKQNIFVQGFTPYQRHK